MGVFITSEAPASCGGLTSPLVSLLLRPGLNCFLWVPTPGVMEQPGSRSGACALVRGTWWPPSLLKRQESSVHGGQELRGHLVSSCEQERQALPSQGFHSRACLRHVGAFLKACAQAPPLGVLEPCAW